MRENQFRTHQPTHGAVGESTQTHTKKTRAGRCEKQTSRADIIVERFEWRFAQHCAVSAMLFECDIHSTKTHCAANDNNVQMNL